MAALELGDAAVGPAVAEAQRALGVFAVGVIGRAFVERDDEIGAELALDVDRAFRRQQVLAAVDVGTEGRTLFADLEQRLGPRDVAPALDLVGDRAVAEAEDLEAAGIGQHRAVPAHEAVQPAHLRHQVGARLQHQMIGVGEDDLRLLLAQAGRRAGLHRRLGGAEDEGRRVERAVRRGQPPAPRARALRVLGDDVEREVGVGERHAWRSTLSRRDTRL